MILKEMSIRFRIWQLMAVAALAVSIFAVLVLATITRAHEAGAWVEHTDVVLAELQAYAEDAIKAETAQYGFLLTQHQDYLEPYRAAAASHRGRLERLLQLTADNPDQTAKLAQLGAIVRERFELLEQSIRMAENGAVEQARTDVRKGLGKAVMDEFQRVRAESAAIELDLLAQRRQTMERENAKIIIFVIAGAASFIVLLILATIRTISRIDRPLQNLLKGIDALSAGDFAHRVAVSSQDEIGRVGSAFNSMSEHLRQAIAAREAAHRKLGRYTIELERSNRELDSFAYIASHDLKSPLRGIRSLADWISEDLKNGKIDADTLENLALLHGRVERLDMLLEGLLQYSRVGRTASSVEQVDTAQIIAEITVLLAPPANFTVTCTGEMPLLFTQRAPLALVFRNLIDNALKHHDGVGGKIVVSAQDTGDLVEFRVEDDGPGIAAAYHEKIFGIFQTLKPRDKVEGSGIGLAIVKKTVESHGGAIRVESRPPARGTAFIFTWGKEKAAVQYEETASE